MELFKIAPFDQILRVESLGAGSTLLNDGTKTLGQLKVCIVFFIHFNI